MTQKYGIFSKNENTFENRVRGWELLEEFDTEYDAQKELEEYYIPENEKLDEEEKCEFKIDEV